MRFAVFCLTIFTITLSIPQALEAAPPTIKDEFGRTLNGRTITLVDWEGPIANPAVRIRIYPHDASDLPGYVFLETSNPRILFEGASDESGKTIVRQSFRRGKAYVEQYISLFPDSNTRDEDNIIVRVKILGNSGKYSETAVLRFRELDQDRNRRPEFRIDLDFSYDVFGFLRSSSRRAIVRRAADEWAYYFADQNVQSFGPGELATWILDRRKKNKLVRNKRSTRGTLLYVTSFNDADRFGSPGRGRAGSVKHKSNGRKLPISASGVLAFKPAGVPGNNQRWKFISGGALDNWKRRMNGPFLYHTAVHEIGHALGFSGGNKIWQRWYKARRVLASAVSRYVGGSVRISGSAHVPVVDPVSRFGMYGSSAGKMPGGMALITKGDLLMMREIGYRLRDTSPFGRMRIYGKPPRLRAGRSYSFRPRVYGGTPMFQWSLAGGSLPAGLKLNSFTGEISGTPSSSSGARIRLRLRDSGDYRSGVTATFNLSGSGSSGPVGPGPGPSPNPGRVDPPDRPGPGPGPGRVDPPDRPGPRPGPGRVDPPDRPDPNRRPPGPSTGTELDKSVAGRYFVQTRRVNVRSGPGLKNRRLFRVRRGMFVKVIGRTKAKARIGKVRSYWYYIEFKGRRGWIFGTNIRKF